MKPSIWRLRSLSELEWFFLDRHALRMDSNALDCMLARLENFDGIAGNGHPCACFGNDFQLLHDKTIERLGAVDRQYPTHQTIELTHIGAGVNDVAVITLLRNTDVGGYGATIELADDLAQDVLGCDQALHIAILVHDEGCTAPLFLKTKHLLRERCALGNKVRFARILQ